MDQRSSGIGQLEHFAGIPTYILFLRAISQLYFLNAKVRFCLLPLYDLSILYSLEFFLHIIKNT